MVMMVGVEGNLQLVGSEAGPGSLGGLWLVNLLFGGQGPLHVHAVPCGNATFLTLKPPTNTHFIISTPETNDSFFRHIRMPDFFIINVSIFLRGVFLFLSKYFFKGKNGFKGKCAA